MATCTFCGSAPRVATSLVAGPDVFICADCVSYAGSVIEEAAAAAPSGGSSTAPALRCSFCDRPAAQVRWIIAGPDVQICDQCVGVAQEAIAGRQ